MLFRSESLVQIFVSSQIATDFDLQDMPAHSSSRVQTLSSVQVAWFGKCLQLCISSLPIGSQLSSVQTLPSSQLYGAPATQAPSLQASPVVQPSPSTQVIVFGR